MTGFVRTAADPSEAPIAPPDVLFAGLASAKGLVLAVSGGPDSTALMVLAARWAARPPVLVATVDHGLRSEAAAEVRIVEANAARLGLPCRTFRIDALPGGNRQAAAREARYGCLMRAASEVGFDTVVTAHHLEDQAETFLLRLARGSGVYGLGAMRDSRLVEGIVLARPLLDCPRAALHQVAAASGLPVVSDPSNADLRSDRVRMRRLMPDLARHGFDAGRLAGTARRLGRAADALDWCCERLVFERCAVSDAGEVSGPIDAILGVPEEIGDRALARMLTAVGGAAYTPDLVRVQAVRRALAAPAPAGTAARTLHGAVVTVADGRFRIAREWGRAGLPVHPVHSGTAVIWDRRFRVTVPELPGQHDVAALGAAAAAFACDGVGRSALRTLPALYSEDRLVAVPELLRDSDHPVAARRFRAECLVRASLYGEGAGVLQEPPSLRPSGDGTCGA